MAEEEVFLPYQHLLEEDRTCVIMQVADCMEGKEFIATYPYDLIILAGSWDIDQVLQCIKWVRTKGYDTPILIILRPSSTESMGARLLDCGADYIFNALGTMAEFGAVTRALMRRYHNLSTSKIFVGPLVIDLLEHQVYANNHVVDLTNKEQAILECLVLNKGRILSKEALLAHVYGGMDEPEIRIIDAFIWRIRKKLGDAGLPENYMQTVWGRGYRFLDNDDADED